MANKFVLICLVAINVWQLVLAQSESACQIQKKKDATNKSPLKLDVRCLDNGDYAPLQCFPENKFCYCALPDGNQITSPSRNRKFCKCDLENYQAKKKLGLTSGDSKPPKGTYVPNCQRDGLYYQKQCESETNVCWCVNQDGSQISKDKKVGITCN